MPVKGLSVISLHRVSNMDNHFVPRVRHKVQGVGHCRCVRHVSCVDNVVIWNKDLITFLGMIIHFYFLNCPSRHLLKWEGCEGHYDNLRGKATRLRPRDFGRILGSEKIEEDSQITILDR